MAARITRGLHFGVLVGFAAVATKFDPSNQYEQVMKTMCTSPEAILDHDCKQLLIVLKHLY